MHTKIATIVLGILSGAALPAGTIYTASAGTGSSNTIGNCIGGGSFSGSVPTSASENCGDQANGNGIEAFSTPGHLGADGTAVVSGFGPISQIGATASLSDDSLIFSANPQDFPSGFITVSLNMLAGGVLNSTHSGDAQISFLASLGGTGLATFSEDHGNGVVLACNSTFFLGAGCGSVAFGAVTTGSIQVPINVPLSLFMQMELIMGASNGGNASADFSHSFDFPTGSAVFNVPAGVTVNAPGLQIANNVFGSSTATPEPSTMGMCLLALGALVKIRTKL